MRIYLRSQCTILPMSRTEKWKESADKRKTFAALLTNLFKSFDCLLHDIIANCNAYGFSF